MGLFKNKKKLQLVNVKATTTRAVYQHKDFPTIDITFKVADDDEARRSDTTEVTISMTLWEANEFVKQAMLIVTNTTRLQLPKSAINIPWGEGGNI